MLRSLYEKTPGEESVVTPFVGLLLGTEAKHREAYDVIQQFEAAKRLPPTLKRMKVVATETVKGLQAALDLAKKHVEEEPDEPGHYITLSGYLHSTGEISKAIEVSKKGVEIAEKAKAAGRNDELDEVMAKLKGNLAYFLADLGLPEHKELALRYAQEAHSVRSDSKISDTLGLVLITYGDSRADIERGMALCKEANKDAPTRRFYERAVARAVERLA